MNAFNCWRHGYTFWSANLVMSCSLDLDRWEEGQNKLNTNNSVNASNPVPVPRTESFQRPKKRKEKERKEHLRYVWCSNQSPNVRPSDTNLQLVDATESPEPGPRHHTELIWPLPISPYFHWIDGQVKGEGPWAWSVLTGGIIFRTMPSCFMSEDSKEFEEQNF
jgi:hypothetical protein